MAQLSNLKIQHTGQNVDVLIRELNRKLVDIRNVVNLNAINRWDDLRFPVAGIDPVGPGAAPGADSVNGGLRFSPILTEVVAFQAQMPHAWLEGSAIRPHVHWQKTTSAAGDVLWRFEYKHAPIGEVMDAAFTALDSTTLAGGTPDNDTTDEHLITTFSDIDMTGNTISHMLLCKLSRIGGDGSDTYGADARLMEIDIHFETDYPGGSPSLLTK